MAENYVIFKRNIKNIYNMIYFNIITYAVTGLVLLVIAFWFDFKGVKFDDKDD